MKKKRSSGGGANWMDTYGDMVTLLLCFFVLLYSMSTISTENWKALVMSFNPKARQIMTEVPSGGDGPSADADSSGVMDTQDNPDGSEGQLWHPALSPARCGLRPARHCSVRTAEQRRRYPDVCK